MGFGKDGKGVIIRESRTQALSTLAVSTALLIGTKLVTLERFRMIKCEIFATIFGATTGELAGMRLGLADGDLSLTEIDECIEVNGPLGPNDQISDARAQRPVWEIGQSKAASVGGADVLITNENNGAMMSKTIRWTFSRTKSWNWFIYNLGTAPTTGATVNIKTKLFGVWVT